MSRYHQQPILPKQILRRGIQRFRQLFHNIELCRFASAKLIVLDGSRCHRYFFGELHLRKVRFQPFLFQLILETHKAPLSKTIMDTNRNFAKGIDMKYLFMLCCNQRERLVRDYDTTRTVCMSTGIRKLCPVLRNF